MARLPYPSRTNMSSGLADLLNGLPRNNFTEMLAHADSMAEPFLRLLQTLYNGSAELSSRQRELVILAVSGLVECEYEYLQHVPMVEAVGIDPDLRDIVRRGDFDAAHDAGERALLALAAGIVRGPQVTDELFGAARTHLSDRQIVETLQLVGLYWAIGRTCTVLDLELDIPEGLESINAVANMGN
jgi:alkylhydroperoxidase family enzyme